jgi:hypothetical protein
MPIQVATLLKMQLSRRAQIIVAKNSFIVALLPSRTKLITQGTQSVKVYFNCILPFEQSINAEI